MILEESWSDRPRVIVGCGRSLLAFDFDLLADDRIRVLAVKNAVYHLPTAAAGFGSDTRWMRREAASLEGLGFPLVLAIPPKGAKHINPVAGAIYVNRMPGCGFSRIAPAVHMVGSSGFGALNFAYHKRPPLIALLGFDYGGAVAPGSVHHRSDEYADHHYFDPDRYRDVPREMPRWQDWADAFALAAGPLARAGIKVINGSPDSRIDSFPRVTPAEAVCTALKYQG